MKPPQPGLFGLRQTNRDFSQKEAWGKNQFNSSFPAALCCFMAHKQMPAVHLCARSGRVSPETIAIADVFGIDPADPDTYFAFEAAHTPFQKYIIGSLPRTDLVIQKKSTGQCLAGLEIKLTALPDNTTCDAPEDKYGSEIVARPDTIAYLACSLAESLGAKLSKTLPTISIADWGNARLVLPQIDQIVAAIEKVTVACESSQKPFLIQPIWKTKGKSPALADHCLDVFVWSNAGFSAFIAHIANKDPEAPSITRQTRTAIWLYKMLLEIKLHQHFDHAIIVDALSYNTKNDKAFASAGNVTNRYMACDRLKKPAIRQSEIPEIILGGGQNLLDPKPQLDAAIFYSPELFA